MSDQPAEPQSVNKQVTSQIPATKNSKNPKRVAAGKAIAEKTRQAREAQKKAAAEVAIIIANNKAKETPPPPHVPVEDTNQQNTTENVLTTTQWLSIASILVSVIGLYYKREEIKRVFSELQTTPPSSQPLLEETEIQRPPPPKKGIRGID